MCLGFYWIRLSYSDIFFNFLSCPFVLILHSVFFKFKDKRKLLVFVMCGNYNRVPLIYTSDVKFLCVCLGLQCKV